MDAARHGAGSGTLFDEGYAAIKIAATENNVIEHSGEFMRRPRPRRKHGRASEREKQSAGNQ
jgi:hypothetical protein